MRESVPTARYSPVCNVLRQWKTSLILTYRVYRLYDNSKFKTCEGALEGKLLDLFLVFSFDPGEIIVINPL